ncbi:probable xyloglucan galactosyltransferase GT17 [Argentina anserina]|uniref:probable xyloglucan galactosyltransferase GT17 n=1 Tax=Argentina anserina TaxID=57926 RepID=UPI0021765469|nr:probable xyloglucan galactosyltransferase GT17 [Potentilla anserina]
MLSRKQPPPDSPWKEKEEKLLYYTKNKEPNNLLMTILNNPHLRFGAFVFVFLSAWLLLLLFWFPPKITTTPTTTPNVASAVLVPDQGEQPKSQLNVRICEDPSVSVYVYPLPAKFNTGLLDRCKTLNVYTDMCPHIANHGLGQPKPNMGSAASWFATHQFIAEMIIHARVENHPCRTHDPSRATLFYVPFYGGLYASSKFREVNLTTRDELAFELVEHIQSQPIWQKRHGKDHFIALGRTAWDFMRTTDGPDFGANVLLNLPAVKNMSVLTVERQPWQGANQFGIPYPSYFHPSSLPEMLTWQAKMRGAARPYLFSFIGGPRKGLEKAAIRNEFIRQCAESGRCFLMKCGANGASKCHEPSEVLKVMSESQFCLQAPGDSYTRRSTFDSVLAGCIPVFFSPHTAYTQYKWFLPAEVSEYSVYIDERSEGSKSIEEELLKIPAEKMEMMREKVIQMIPSLTYAHPSASGLGFKDAVDVALASLANHVNNLVH